MITIWRLIRHSTPLIIAVLSFAIFSYAQQPSQADLYRKAAALYRDSAAKCPARKACYLANAQYQDCQASSLANGSSVTCTKPTCDESSPPCESGGSRNENNSTRVGNPSNQPLGNSNASELQRSMDGLRKYFEEKEENRKAASKARKEREREENDLKEDEMNRVTRDYAAEQKKESEIDERSKARSQAYQEQKKAETKLPRWEENDFRITASGSSDLFRLANILIAITDGEGKPDRYGSYLTVENLGRDTFILGMSGVLNLEVKAGETQRFPVFIYRSKTDTFWTEVTIRAKYWRVN